MTDPVAPASAEDVERAKGRAIFAAREEHDDAMRARNAARAAKDDAPAEPGAHAFQDRSDGLCGATHPIHGLVCGINRDHPVHATPPAADKGGERHRFIATQAYPEICTNGLLTGSVCALPRNHPVHGGE